MHIRSLTFLSLILILLSACAAPETPPEPPQPTDTSLPPTDTPQEISPALQPARRYLAQAFDLPLAQIELTSFEEVEWPSSCLGETLSGEVCLQVITPGFRAVFSTPQGDIEVHTDRSGDSFRLAEPLTTPLLNAVFIVWQRSGGIAGICQRMTIDLNGAYLIENCQTEELLTAGRLTADQLEPLAEWRNRFTNFEFQTEPPPGAADVFIDHSTFDGVGDQTPTQAQQEEINSYLASLAGELLTPEADDTSGIRGQALIGPACPGPVRQDTPCPDEPYQATLEILTPEGELVDRIQTNKRGEFKVELLPGSYIIHPVTQGQLPFAQDQSVTVEEGEFTSVKILFDSGIR